MHERERGVTLELFDRISQLKRHLVYYLLIIFCAILRIIVNVVEVPRKMVHDRHTLVIKRNYY